MVADSVQRARCVVRVPGWGARRGFLELGGLRLACAIGRGGIRARKREGDGATPAGSWRLVEVLYRADRRLRPRSGLGVRAIGRADGWCDAPADRNYNRMVRLPYPASAEQLWRQDHLYDILVVTDHNRRPRVKGLGSAIFLHVARAGYRPTEGCIALGERDLRRLLERARPGCRIVIGTQPRH